MKDLLRSAPAVILVTSSLPEQMYATDDLRIR